MHPSTSSRARRSGVAIVLIALATAVLPAARAATPSEVLAGYARQSGSAGVPARGQQFFNATHGHEWSCGSCHGVVPTQPGKHASTGRAIATMAPAFNAERFTDPAKVE